MTPIRIRCESCDRAWAVASGFSVYQQAAIESLPCPHCGAYTLCCPEPEPPRRLRLAEKRRARAAQLLGQVGLAG